MSAEAVGWSREMQGLERTGGRDEGRERETKRGPRKKGRERQREGERLLSVSRERQRKGGREGGERERGKGEEKLGPQFCMPKLTTF